MKRCFAILLAIAFLLTGCAAPLPAADATQQYTATFLTLFDTVTTIIGRAESEEAFREISQSIHDDLLRYHELFDIYNDYEGVNNLKTVNDNAGIAPVTVDKAIIELLTDCRQYYELSGGNDGINDPVNAKLPDTEKLREASNHIGFDTLVIDENASTVYITDPAARLDVGAVAKGWATQKAAENAPSGMLISVGGNVCATGPKLSDGTPWVIGIQDPDAADKNLHTLFVDGGSVVTSGDYQRTYWVEGKPYHHIIDPNTLMPAAYWRSVSIVCADSGLADALSTALFLMDREAGSKLAESCGAEVLWVDAAGEEHMTSGFQEMIRT